MNLEVLAVGKLKDPGLQLLCEDYLKRSRSFLPIDVTEVRDHGALWRRQSTAPGPTVILDERGELPTTLEFSSWLSGWREQGHRRAWFVVGDAHGFDDQERRRADRLLALGRITLPHRLARVVLIEQLYRAGTVLAGHPYHHT